MSGALALAAVCVAMTCLIAEQALQRNRALRRSVESPRRLARLLIGALLPGAMAGAALMALADGRYRSVIALMGFFIATISGAAWLHRADLRSALPWLASMLAPLFLALGCVARTTQAWLIGGLALTVVLALGLPAFIELARRLDDTDVPVFMRPLPARALAASIFALAMAGSVSW